MPWSWELPNTSSPQYTYTPPPPDPFETRQEDSGFVAEPEVQRRIDNALTQYRQEQQAALRNMSGPATYGAPGRQTVAPVTAQAVQSRDYSIPDRVLGQQAQMEPLPWQTTSYAPPSYSAQLGPVVRQEQQAAAPQRQPGYPSWYPPENYGAGGSFTYQVGPMQASSVQPSAYRMPNQTEAARVGRQELVDYAGNVGIPMLQASQVQPAPPREQYDPTAGYFAWQPAPRVQPLPWAEPAIAPLPWNVATNVSAWRR